MANKHNEIKFEDVPFLKSLLKRTQKIYFTKQLKIRNKISPKDIYQRDLLEVCLRLISIIETLRLCRSFLDERLKIIDSNFVINNGEFIRYHLEYYFLRVTSYKDLILKLMKRTYQFKIKENIGLERNLRKESERNGVEVVSNLLKGLDILMKQIEPIRNNIAHGGYHIDPDLTWIESIEITKRQNLNSSEYKDILKRLLEKNLYDMELINLMMMTYLLFVFKKLYPVRKIKEKELSKK